MNEPIFGAEADFRMPNAIMMPNQMRAWTKDYLVLKTWEIGEKVG